MSPTSYQAAPPRDKSILSDVRCTVNVPGSAQVVTHPPSRRPSFPKPGDGPGSPGAVCRAFERRYLVGGGMYVGDASAGLVGAEHDVLILGLPVFLIRHGVHRQRAEIIRADQLVERGRGALLVQCELIDGLAEGEQILVQYGFLAAGDGAVV